MVTISRTPLALNYPDVCRRYSTHICDFIRFKSNALFNLPLHRSLRCADGILFILDVTDQLLGGVSAAAGIAAVNSFANLAGFCSPYLIGWVTTNTGSNAIGMFLITAVLIFGASLVLRVPAKLVNR